MSLFGRLRSEQRSAAPAGSERRYLGSSTFAPSFDGLGVDMVGEQRAMQSMSVFACVRLLADTISAMPWYVYRRDKDNVPHRAFPTPSVIRKPCADMDLFQWKWMVVSSLALRGNSYHLITGRDSSGMPTGLMPIHPDMIFLERRTNVLEWYNPIYRVLGERVPSEDVVHIRRFTMAGEPYGLSPIRQAARAIGINLAADEYGLRYFQDSANPSSVLSTSESLTDDEVERVQAEWISSQGGRRLPAVLTGGFEWKPISISPSESQFIEARNYQVADIARFYGVPPHLVGDQEKSTSWGTGIESMNLGFHTYSLSGWTSCIESTLSNFLPRGYAVAFDPTALLRGDFKTQIEAINLARLAGIYSANEGRARLELGPIPDGDGYLQPLNFGPLGADPEVQPTAKPIQAETAPGVTPPVAAPKGQEPEPSGLGAAPKRGLAELQCRLDSNGSPRYFDPRTGETVRPQEVIE